MALVHDGFHLGWKSFGFGLGRLLGPAKKSLSLRLFDIGPVYKVRVEATTGVAKRA